jgi:hypothetical protein
MKWHRSQLESRSRHNENQTEYQYLMLDLPDWQWH